MKQSLMVMVCIGTVPLSMTPSSAAEVAKTNPTTPPTKVPSLTAPVKTPIVRPRPESGPFGNLTIRPDALTGMAPSMLELRSVEGTLSDDPLANSTVPPAFANGRLIYFLTSTLQKAGNLTEVVTAPSKETKDSKENKSPSVSTQVVGNQTGTPQIVIPRTGATIPSAPLLSTFMVDRTFRPGQLPLVQLYQLAGPQRARPEVPRFFPDGSRLLFQVDDGSRGPNSYRLYVVNLADKSARRLELDALAVRETSISPDGRFLAVAASGAPSERGWDTQAAPFLYLYDLQTNKSRNLLKEKLNNRVPLNLSWTNKSTLLFSLAPPRKIDEPGSALNGPRFVDQRPPLLADIYEVSAATDNTAESEPRLLFQGYAPRDSPDGRWISFQGQMDVNQPNYLMPHACLYDRKTQKRYTGMPGVSEAVWSTDSQRLLLSGSTRLEGASMLRLYSVDMEKWQTQEIGLLPLQSPKFLARSAGATASAASVSDTAVSTTAKDSKVKDGSVIAAATTPPVSTPTSPTRPPFTAQWKPLQISSDGSYLYAQIKTFLPPDKRGFSTEVWNLQAVNLRDASTSLLGALSGATGVAWLSQ